MSGKGDGLLDAVQEVSPTMSCYLTHLRLQVIKLDCIRTRSNRNVHLITDDSHPEGRRQLMKEGHVTLNSQLEERSQLSSIKYVIMIQVQVQVKLTDKPLLFRPVS